MKINEITSSEYRLIFRNNTNVFCSTDFSELNSVFFNATKYLLFEEENKSKAGLVLGVQDDKYIAPPFAPFSGFNRINDTSQESIDKIIPLLVNYSRENKVRLELTFPPIVYNHEFYNLCVNSFSRSEFEISYIDINYHLDVNKLKNNYVEHLSKAGKKNLKNGLAAKKIDLLHSSDTAFISDAYEIISENRISKGYPLKMSLQKVMETIQVIPADFFILEINNERVAAAQVFHVAVGIVQVVYWGDRPGFEPYRPMNVLAYKIFEYYKEKEIKIIDIGPSSDGGIPNYGLCKFKTNIGCDTSLKFKFHIDND